MFKAVKKWQEIAASAEEPQLVFGGEDAYVRSGIHVVGWREMLNGKA